MKERQQALLHFVLELVWLQAPQTLAVPEWKVAVVQECLLAVHHPEPDRQGLNLRGARSVGYRVARQSIASGYWPKGSAET